MTLLDANPLKGASIIEAECIGCTKCIQACPVDAILGAAKLMHTVIGDECIGCGSCIDPCPMDCIELIDLATPRFDPVLAEKRFANRNARLEKQKQIKKVHAERKQLQAYVKSAVLRVKMKKAS